MTTLIEGYVAGDDLDIQRDVTNVAPTDPVTKAWFTVKRFYGDAEPGVLQKIITTAQLVGTGQITQDGSENNGNGTASLLFQVSATETLALGTADDFHFDVQVLTSGGKKYTPDIGRLILVAQITEATS